MTIEVKEKVARKGKRLRGTEWFIEHDLLLSPTYDTSSAAGRYRISLPKESPLRYDSIHVGP